jgi:hypothetical protein
MRRGSMDAANVLKPALARGDIQLIGATTLDEYREHIEKDGALARRFQQVLIDPPTIEETIQILSIMSYSQDLCTVGRSGAFQGQVFGFSTGATVTDQNCERLKLSKYLYDMGMKVASISLLCADSRVFKAMEMAGTPCPYKGKIGAEATLAWAENTSKRPDAKEQEKLYIKQCTHESNPNREKINKDVVGAVKVIYTTKTKTKRQCKKEFYATQ